MKCIIITLLFAAAVNAIPQNASKIVSGFYAKPGEFPYMATLLTSDYSLQCGGSILTNRWILTAAHCYDEDVVYIGVGNIYLPNQMTYSIYLFVTHKYYDSNFLYDIMMVKTYQSIYFYSGVVQPISINTNTYNDLYVLSGLKLSGWGQIISDTPNQYITDNLKWIYYTLQTSSTCLNANTQSGTGLYYNPSIQLCAMAQYTNQYNRGSCFGDSGGPLVYNGIQYGIISRGMSDTCAVGYPDVFTRVSTLSSWINNVKNYY